VSHPTNEFRVFISSTFVDLQPEREQLVKKTFPRIRAKCRERGVEFVEIDLRWGITEEESRTGKTIRICLEEIDRCRPYFIGILGTRYGWVPGTTEIEKDPEMLAAYPWLPEYAEKSIIEMEFAHGAMRGKNESAFFYEQVNLPLPLKKGEAGRGSLREEQSAVPRTTPQPPPSLGGGVGTLDELKLTLQSTGAPYRRFSSPEELGEQVYNDLLAILDRDFPVAKELTPLEHERIEHQAYARNRRQSYVANPEYYDVFVKHVQSEDAPLVICGPSGLGKSALMAYLAHEYQERNPDAFVVQHFIGAAEGTTAEDVMRHILLEIKERLAISDDIPNDAQLREEFPTWLAKIAEQKLVLFIDALNQLSGIALEMHWLPDFIPPNVRLVVSTTPEQPLEELRKRNWNELEMKPLTGEQVETIAANYLGEFRKVLQPEQRAMIAAEDKTRRPLFLRTVLEEVRVFGHHSGLTDHLANFLASENELDLFQRVLARMERDHGEAEVRAVMTAIWAARHGLSETEIMEVTKLPRIKLSELLIAMEYHLMQREGLYTFFHNYLREGVELRYLSIEADESNSSPLGGRLGGGLPGTSSTVSPRDHPPAPSFLRRGSLNAGETGSSIAHELLARYFSTREYAARRREEEPWQWRAANNIEALWRSLADPEMFMLFANEEQRYHFIAYLQSFERERTQELFRALHDVMRSDATFDRRLELAQTARIAGYYDAATEILGAITELAAGMELDYKTSLCLKREWAQLYGLKHEYKLALPLCEEIVALIETREGKSEELFNAMIDLSTVMHGEGDYAGAEQVIRHALEFGSVAPNSMQLNAMQNLAALVLAQGHKVAAIELHEQAYQLSRTWLGRMHPSSLAYSLNLSAALIFAERFTEALGILEITSPAIRNVLGDKHEWYIASVESLGQIKKALGDFEAAILIYTELIFRSTLSHGEEAEKTLIFQLGLGHIFYIKGDVDTAFDIYSKYLPLLGKVLGTEHPVFIRSNKTFNNISEKRNKRNQG